MGCDYPCVVSWHPHSVWWVSDRLYGFVTLMGFSAAAGGHGLDSKIFTALKFVYSRLFLHFTAYALVGKVKDEFPNLR